MLPNIIPEPDIMSVMKRWEHLKISFAEIKEATNDFEKIVGEGGYGPVYEGKLSINGEHIKVAVKRLNEQIGQGLKQFLTEIQLLSGQQHENVITLVGYCDEGKEKIIVYEYAEHGSLDRYIKRNYKSYTLTWLERLRIVAHAARGLDYLHNHVIEHQTIIHRDIKCSNILLDDKWVAKISDLGLSKLTFSGSGTSTVISEACGTWAYVEPEYFVTRFVHKKSDVYSFGIVLFEVLCGRLCYVKDKDGILLSAGVAKKHYDENKLDMIIDPILREQMSPESLRKFSAIAYECLQDREHRPSMSVVKKELEETLIIQALIIQEYKEHYADNKHDMIIDHILWEQMSPESLRKFSAIVYECLQGREHRLPMSVVKKEHEETLIIKAFSKKNTGKKKELSPQDAAELIQMSFRGYLVRRYHALRALRELAIAKEKLKELRSLFNNFSYRRRVARDAEEKQKFSEKILVLLLTVDDIEGADIMVRAAKRSMVDELEAMLDVVDPQPGKGRSLSLKRRTFDMPDGVIQKEVAEGVAQVVRMLEQEDGSEIFEA